MATETLTGGCLCGAVAYRITGPFLKFAHCHCSRCRKATGTGHATNLYVPPGQFQWTQGGETVVRYDLPTARSFATEFCPVCGAPLPHHTRSGREVVIPAGSLEQHPNGGPQCHIFWDSRPPWSRIDDDLPKHAALPDWWASGRPQPPGDKAAEPS